MLSLQCGDAHHPVFILQAFFFPSCHSCAFGVPIAAVCRFCSCSSLHGSATLLCTAAFLSRLACAHTLRHCYHHSRFSISAFLALTFRCTGKPTSLAFHISFFVYWWLWWSTISAILPLHFPFSEFGLVASLHALAYWCEVPSIFHRQ